jgi:hypothetical protein
MERFFDKPAVSSAKLIHQSFMQYITIVDVIDVYEHKIEITYHQRTRLFANKYMNRIFRVFSSFVIGGFLLLCSLNLRSNYPPFCPGAVSQRNWFVTKREFIYLWLQR